MIKIILADDHPLVREGIRSRFDDVDDINIINMVSDGIELLKKMKDNLPDVVVLDISMPKMDGLEVSKKIKAKFPTVKILILTMHDNEQYLHYALKSGASGYILKDIEAKKMIEAIRIVAKGGEYFCQKITQITKKQALAIDLTNKEYAIVKCLLDGLGNRDIAEKLFISVRTVECHRSNIYKKLGVNSIAGLFKYTESIGLFK